ncbi:NAD(P)-dependent oxidoreductase [Streptomyces sp. NPDC020141]|uniref:NAD(P)-dependent oxidoreductase n=1 Tax=Streptomyces sp. NPDC020141 TaxID=3365065 RepID=UPI00379B4683
MSKRVDSGEAVTVVGLGPMGRAMAGALLDAGHPVTVWNRTASRADALVARGAVLAPTAAEALAAGELVLLSLTDHEAMYGVLGGATAATGVLDGRVLVNLGSDTPGRAREAAEWAAGHGARYLTGGVLSSPEGIGDRANTTHYSGPEDVFEAHRATLEVLTSADYRGEDPGLAALLYQLQMDVFWTTVLSFAHATAVAHANGVPVRDVLSGASSLLATIPRYLEFCASRIEAGEHPGDLERLSMALASAEHVVRTTEEAGVDATLPDAVRRMFRRGVDAGHADDGFTSLVGVLGRPAPPAAES